jgi:hypothetical protein
VELELAFSVDLVPVPRNDTPATEKVNPVIICACREEDGSAGGRSINGVLNSGGAIRRAVSDCAMVFDL